MLSSFMTFCYCFLFVLMTSSLFWLLLLFLFLTLFLFVAVAAAAVLFGAYSNNNEDYSNNNNNCCVHYYVIWNLCTASWVHCLFVLPCMRNMKGVSLLHNYLVSFSTSSCLQGIQQSVCSNWLVFKHFIITLWLTSPPNVRCVRRSWLLFHTFCSFAFVKLPVKKRRKAKEENNKKELPTRSFSVTKLAVGEERRAMATIMLTCVRHRGRTDLRGMAHTPPQSTQHYQMSGSVNERLCFGGPCYAIVEKFQIAVSFYRWLSFSYRYRHFGGWGAESLPVFAK